MRSLGPLVVVEPHGPLELVSGVQQQHVALLAADPADRRGSAGRPGEAPAAAPALPGVRAGLLHPGVHVVGVEENQVPGRRGGHGEARQEEQEEGEEEEAHRSHLSAARTNTAGGNSSYMTRRDLLSAPLCSSQRSPHELTR